MEFKYKLLKAVDIAGLNFLRPLYYSFTGRASRTMEENRTANPRAFTGRCCIYKPYGTSYPGKFRQNLESYLSPTETIGAAGSIQTFAKREDMKESAYSMKGKPKQIG